MLKIDPVAIYYVDQGNQLMERVSTDRVVLRSEKLII